MLFLTPRYLKEAKHYRHALKRIIHYKEDILPEKELETLRELRKELESAMRARSREKVAKAQQKIDDAVGQIVPPAPDAGIRENVEVFLVAIVIAAGVRAYFLQPFKIPTGSMQPTLYGITSTVQSTPPPNLLVRAVEMVWLGRHYINLVAKEDDVIQDVKESTYLNFFTFTTIQCENRKYTLFAPVRQLVEDFDIKRNRPVKAGEVMARGYIQTGDQVFVDKMSYHFAGPGRGNVFVFKTTGIHEIEKTLPPGMSQHYIKRLAGVPGDLLSIDQPKLLIDGKVADQWVFQRVMSMKDDYNGYTNVHSFPFLNKPSATFPVQPKTYFALGDNSRNSKDSRDFGAVPEANVAGRGFFVYWPFSSRWGFIR